MICEQLVSTLEMSGKMMQYICVLQVAAVEDEMRELLQETQASKKAMEDKVKRLTRAMTELQSALI